MTRRVDAIVLGAAGLVGSHVREALRDRPTLATYHRTPAPGGVRLDVTDAEAVRDLVLDYRPHIVVLAAAEPHVEQCEREPQQTRSVNVEATRTVVEASAAVGAIVVFFSSEYVFRGDKGPYRENEPVEPINEYGRQKVEAERIVRAWERHVICRTSGVFGWETLGKNFVSRLVRRLRSGEVFDVPSDQVITPTPAPDLARAVVELTRTGYTGTLHVVGPRVLPRVAFAHLVADAFSLPAGLIRPRPTSELGLTATRPTNAGLRDDRLRLALGRPLRDPAEALAEMRSTEPGSA